MIIEVYVPVRLRVFVEPIAPANNSIRATRSPASDSMSVNGPPSGAKAARISFTPTHRRGQR